MKTISKNGEISRVSDETAFLLVKSGSAKYAPKSVYKKIRDAGKTKKEEVVENKKTQK